MEIKKLFEINSYLSGFIQALLMPALGTALLLPFFRLLIRLTGSHFIDDSGILLLSIIPNLLVMRYYIIKAGLENTGRGIIVVTLILVVLFFAFIHGHSFAFPL